ncbi:MAG: tetratricopeptide repeat protein [Syntrophomonadales bacterium]|jgi:outer membrane protein assembly factor BamD (BamD/ComL family)
MREKVDYNVALCYIHLKYYGYEIRNLYNEGELDNLLVESLNAFIEKYPNSEMMARALLALGLEEPNEKALQELIERYPDTGEAKRAREYLIKNSPSQ